MTFKVNELEQSIRKNGREHCAIFERAVEGYRTAVIKALDSRLEDVKAGRKVDLYIRLPEPTNHTADYDSVLEMLAMTTAEQIVLDQDMFRMYVLDEWDWQQDFKTTASNYTHVD